MINKIKNYIKTYKKISALILLVLLFVSFKVFKNGNGDEEIFTVKRGSISQKVIVSGKVKPVSDADLSFEKVGKVLKVYVNVGDKVSVGQSLVSLDQSSAYADFLKAKSNVVSEEAKLEELKIGSTKEEIALKETEVSNAEIALKNSETNLSNKIEDAYVKSDDAIRNYTDGLFSNPRGSSPQINIFVSDNSLKNDINYSRLDIENFLNTWSVSDFSANKENITKTEDALYKMKTFLDKVAIVVNSLSSNSSLSQTTIDTYKSNVSTARTNITTAISNLSSAEEKWNTAKANLAVSKRELELTKSGSTPEQIKAQEAKVLQYKAEEQRMLSELNKLTLRSPINGVVTKQDSKEGETVSSGVVYVSVISDGNYEIEANVSEVSVGKVSVGNPVSIKMDAFPEKIFYGKVSYIEPGETIVDGVVNYKTTIIFDQNYPEIKTGLTTSLDIEAFKVDNVLVIPQYAVSNMGGENLVSLIVGNKKENKKISLGRLSSDGMVEVLDGLLEGQKISIVSKK